MKIRNGSCLFLITTFLLAPAAVIAKAIAAPQNSHEREIVYKPTRTSFSHRDGYYVDFLARPTENFGHSFVQLSRISDAGGRYITATVGFYPRNSSGELVFNAPGIAKATRLDERSSTTVDFRLGLSKESFIKVTKYIQNIRKTWRTYDLLGKNCNHLVGQVAKNLGLNVPTDFDDLPENYVRSLRAQNDGRTRATWLRNPG